MAPNSDYANSGSRQPIWHFQPTLSRPFAEVPIVVVLSACSLYSPQYSCPVRRLFLLLLGQLSISISADGIKSSSAAAEAHQFSSSSSSSLAVACVIESAVVCLPARLSASSLDYVVVGTPNQLVSQEE